MILRWLIGIVFFASFSSSSWAENMTARTAYPTALSVEAMGRGLMGGIYYDKSINDDFAAGVGVGAVGIKTYDETHLSSTAKLIPVYGNYYFLKQAGTMYATLGFSWITQTQLTKGNRSVAGKLDFPDHSLLPQLGLGYENRTDKGFLLRMALYALMGKKAISPWAGFGFGVCF